MRERNISSIKEIIESISVNDKREVLYFGKPIELLPLEIRRKEITLKRNLEELIYRIYTRSNNITNNDHWIPKHDNTFTNELSRVNQTSNGWSCGWLIRSILKDNLFLLTQNYEYIKAFAGHFIIENQSHGQPEQGDRVSIRIKKEFFSDEDYFYYGYSSFPSSPVNDNLFRLYWNTSAEGAIKLLGRISERFNKFNIPYIFKCIAHPDNYGRADAAVVYVDKLYFGISMLLVKDVYASVSSLLRKDTPMFSLPISDGLGFAEDPSEESSFGMIRSNVIAESIIEGANAGINDKSILLNLATKKIEALGYQVDRFHLNVNSHFPYNFPIF